jgi:outer membrane lipoprotein-sorting protein
MGITSWRGTWICSLVLAFGLAGSSTWAAAPGAESLLQKMKAALEPAKASTRTMTFQVYSKRFNETTQIVVRQARKTSPDGARCVTVVMSPETLKGVAMLVAERKGKASLQYVYLPALRRVRQLVGSGAFEPFLGSDFTYSDVGLTETHDRSLKLLGEKAHAGTKAYELEETPKATFYYSRIVDWIAADSGLPLERDHYDVANVLWRKQIFEEVAVVDDVPTPMHVRMDDLESGDWSDYRVTELQYEVSVPDEVFDPDRLDGAAQNPVWSAPSK